MEAETPKTEAAPRPGKPRWRRRLWRIARWTLGVLAGFIALVVIIVWLILANLNHSAVKSRVISLVKSQTGLTIDYEGLEVSPWSGVRARTISVAGPPRFATHSTKFVSIDDLDVEVSLWSLPFGDLSIDALRVGSIDVEVVIDADGATTLSELFPGKDEPEKDEDKEPTPLSRTATTLPVIAIGEISIGAIRGRVIEASGDEQRRETRVSALSVNGRVKSGSDGLRGTAVTIAGAPTLAAVVTDIVTDAVGPRHGELGLTIEVAAESRDRIELRASAQLEQQDVVELQAPVRDVLGLEAAIVFDIEAGKTTLGVTRLDMLDKSVVASMSIELPDGESFTALADGKVRVDLPRSPIASRSLAFEALELSLDARKLSWAAGRLAGAFDLAVGLSTAAVATEVSSASVAGLELAGSGAFDGPEGVLTATGSVARADASADGSVASLAALTLDVRGDVREAGGAQMASATATAAFAALDATTPTSSAAVKSGRITGKTDGKLADLVLGTIASFESTFAFDTLVASAGRDRVSAKKLVATASGSGLALDPSAPAGLSGKARVGADLASLEARSGGEPIRARAIAARFELPLSLSTLAGSVSLASASVGGKAIRGLDLDVDLASPLELVPGVRGSGAATISGRLAGFRVEDNRGGVPSLRAVAEKDANDVYKLELEATGSSLAIAGKALPGSLRAALRGRAALDASIVAIDASVRGADGAELLLDVDAGVSRRGLRYKANVSAKKLEAFAGALAEVSPSSKRVKMKGATLTASAEGNLSGVLLPRSGQAPRLAAKPLAAMRGSQRASLELENLDYREPGRRLVIPALSVAVSSEHRAGSAGTARATVVSSSIELESGGEEVRIAGLDETLDARFERAPDSGVVEVTSTLAIGSLAQSAFPEYVAANVKLVAKLEIDRLESLYVRSLSFDNPASGTRLFATGALERTGASPNITAEAIPGRQALTLEGRLTQKLDHLGSWGIAERARGSFVVPFRLESGDLLSYRVVAKLMATKVSYVSRDKSIIVDDLSGVIPFVEEVALLPSGLVVIPGPRTSPLTRTRFFDVHPFLDSDDYITARSITVAGQTIGPLAGNVRFARSVFSIDQMQVGFRGGQIAGRVQAAYREGDPIVQMRLNITGVRPTDKNDVLDANLALTFVPRDLTLDGKVQIVRLSRSHLLELLSIIDPFHETVNVNKVRLGLKVGYPKFVRLRMHDGALDAKVELAGAAKIVRIDEIKAVPLGPIMQKYVAPSISGLLPRSKSQPKATERRQSPEVE